MSISLSPNIFSPYYSLDIEAHRRTTCLTMRVAGTQMTTHGMKRVVPLLRRHLPSILHSTCFNDKQLPFCEEVRGTELGHLYEHILLEKLTQLSCGSMKVYKGVTSWDWNKEAQGTFHIKINANMIESLLLQQAINESNQLMSLLIDSSRIN